MLFVVLSAMPVFSRNFTYEYEGHTLTYTVISEEEKTCKTRDGYNSPYLVAGNPVEGDLIIPSIARDGDEVGYVVTAIGSSSFFRCDNLTSVTFPNTITSIGYYAFEGCNSLTSLTIPNSVNSIANYSFKDCTNLTSVDIGDNVISIGDNAFWDCNSLNSLTFGKSLKTIGEYAFNNCTNLSSVTIPPSVSEVKRQAFSGCKSLKEVILSDGSEPITFGILAFPKTSIESLYVGRNYTSESYGSYSHKPFNQNDSLTHLTISESVTAIEVDAFRECKNLQTVNIPNSVTTIGDAAFNRCIGLIEVQIGDGVKSIGHGAFSICSNLALLKIGNSVETISNEAFYTCKSLTSVKIPSTVVSIESGAFKNCTDLRDIVIEDGTGVLNFAANVFDDVPIETLYLGRNFMYESPSSLPFNKATITSLTIGQKVTSIADGAFRYCKGLTSLIIPNSVTVIGSNAFYYCNGLTSLTLSSSLSSIGDSAFSNCNELTDVYYLTDSPIEAGIDIFSNVTYRSANLWVNEKAIPICETINPWRNFNSIKEFISSGIGYIESDNKLDIVFSTPYNIFDFNGMNLGTSIESLNSGIYVVRQGKVTKKIMVK